ncbi:MAG: type I restriction-modification enzyme R subunit C-terminal domain-containing protein [Niameybacter sp.]|uniref:type I restriction-modification enzyme R subunit C-terminal domain-containing protein n=1 Tax=Niameybacter sp. TaxID=2033640 RepID=UPI002FCC815F
MPWSVKETYTDEQLELLRDHCKTIRPLITPLNDDELAKRFDYLIYTVDLAYLQNKNATKPIRSIVQTAEQLSKKGTIPQVMAQKYVIEKVQTDEFWESADILELEEVRIALRDLLKFIDKEKQPIYYTDFKDQILEINENGAMYNSNDLKDYKKKVEHYLKAHQDELAIYKLRNNKQLTQQDLKTLERIMWEELGSKAEYEKEYGTTPISKLVRKIVGLDRGAANEAFSKFLGEEKLNMTQVRYVKLIVDYVVANGMIDDNTVLMEEPFRSLGSIPVLFKENMTEAREIMTVIQEIKKNSEVIA